jgi:hypothetical protein
MSRSGRPPLAGGSTVADGKKISKLSRCALATRRAADRAKLLANLAGYRAGCPASRAAGAPSTPSTPNSPQTRSERYVLHSAEKSIAKTLAEPPSSPNGSERAPLATANPSAPAASVNDDDNDDVDDADNNDEVMTAPPVGTNAWSFSAVSETPLYPPWPNSSHLLWMLSSNLPTTTLV